MAKTLQIDLQSQIEAEIKKLTAAGASAVLGSDAGQSAVASITAAAVAAAAHAAKQEVAKITLPTFVAGLAIGAGLVWYASRRRG